MQVILARPCGFCAGVVRAIDVVEIALEMYSPPVHVLHEIVHNHRVVVDLTRRGARFVEMLDQVPSGTVLILSAHGASTAVARAAEAKNLKAVIDATCPLVAKVHLEVARHARAGREVVAIGHAAHPEMRGTLDSRCLTRDGAYAVFEGSEAVDVTAALFPEWAYCAPDSPEMLATMTRLERDHSRGGLLYWRHLECTDQREGAFLAGTLWVAQY
jgi:4-hydroxy-3-methylbut-2-enyl diphosphate reductase